MTDCEYIKLCEKAFGATVPGCKNDHWRGCPNYDLIVLVHNKAIEAVLDMAFSVDELGHFCIPTHELKALRKPEGGG